MHKFIYPLGLAILFVTTGVEHASANPLQSFTCPQNQKIVAGLNKGWTTHDKVKRKFHAEFPEVSPDTPVGVIFSWHGVGSDIEEWRYAFPLADYSSSLFPFIVITPEDTDLKPLGRRKGFDWDLFKSVAGDDNLEAMLFESVLGCLSLTHKISADQIYSAGFSAGAMVSSMLQARYPKLVAAVYAGSGAWVNDLAQKSLIHIPFGIGIGMEWPALNNEDHGAVLMTYGGKDDAIRFGTADILNFHNAAVLAQEFLPKHGRTTVSCEHDGGHFFHPLISAEEVVRFFSMHVAGQPSPYRELTQLPRFLSNACQLAPSA